MSEAGKEKARALLRLLSVADRVREEGGQLLTVIVDGVPGPTGIYEQHAAEWVAFACGWRDERGRTHGGCGKRWGAAKLVCDPDPPIDPDGRHDGCVRLHAVECATCREDERTKARLKKDGAGA